MSNYQFGYLEKTLKVEVSAGDKKKVLEFDPVEKDPGHYTATFFPTVQTTYNYRVFGNVSNTPISLTWTCSPGSVSEDAVISNSSVKISDGVIRKAIVGGFSCPEPRSDSSFPEKYTSNIDMNNTITNLQKEIIQPKSEYNKHGYPISKNKYQIIGSEMNILKLSVKKGYEYTKMTIVLFLSTGFIHFYIFL